tara:strand:- start:177 stop:479 length:303 start_codon:yes stop_codon:yes gene_type:complete
MPLDYSDFPEEVQVAFFIHSMLSDRWDGASGSYLGKDYSSIEYVLNLHEIHNPKVIFSFVKMYDTIIQAERFEKQERERKQRERKSKGSSGKNYTHNVKG